LGNPDLALEQSANLDVGLNWKAGAHRFGVSAFVNRFNNYIALDVTGRTQDDLPEYAYTQTQARFKGLEASGNVRLQSGARTVDLELRGDLVRALNTQTGQALARIAPARAGATLVLAQGPWSARVGASRAAAQTHVPADELSTGAYTLWNASLAYRARAGAANLLWFARLDNLSNTLAYSASSILTQTAPGKAPLPGRSVKLGLQVSF
jgi:iron complex outermembrane receptor protein